jgi:hypothetical protein
MVLAQMVEGVMLATHRLGRRFRFLLLLFSVVLAFVVLAFLVLALVCRFGFRSLFCCSLEPGFLTPGDE